MRYPVTGRCDDLLALFARAEGAPPEPRFLGNLEAPINLAGRLLAALSEFVPAETMLRVHDRTLKLLAGQELPFDDGAGFQQALDLARGVGSSPPPALVCLISHPPASGPRAHLNIELMRHALRALRLLRGKPCRPRMLIAVDPFALDMLTPLKVFLYAGFMGHYHLGLDRLAHSRGFLSRLVMAKTAWPSAAFRISRHLKGGGELGMVLAGGVPATSRILYASREFLMTLVRERAVQNPLQVKNALLEERDFSEFLRAGFVGEGLARSAWRLMEAWVIARATEGQGLDETRRGLLPEAARQALASCSRALGYSPSQTLERVRGFEAEYARQTPWRERLFRFLAASAVSRPVVLVPLTHSEGGAQLRFGQSAAILGLSRSLLRLRRKRGRDWKDEETHVANFAREFVRENFL